ncbi:MAG: hypothetical protein KBC95_02485 [Candidatus Peribacteraceae bacterium]|nr:hypothetical protein [Candidatus Peribacteraceae bacterium]
MRQVEVPVSRLLLSNHVVEAAVISYADLIARGFADAVHKVVVAEVFPGDARSRKLAAELEAMELADPAERNFVVIEGNHRAVAHALMRLSLPCLELENDADLEECRRLAEEGRGGRFVHRDTELEPLIRRALEMSATHLTYSPRIAVEHARELVRTQTINVLELPRFLRDQVLVS